MLPQNIFPKVSFQTPLVCIAVFCGQKLATEFPVQFLVLTCSFPA